MGGTQLELFELTTFEATCPRCGHHFKQTTGEIDRDHLLKELMEHPDVKALLGESRLFLKFSPLAFLMGHTVGVSLWGRESVYTPSAAHKQLRKLVASKVVVTEQKGKYHQYRLVVAPKCETGKIRKNF